MRIVWLTIVCLSLLIIGDFCCEINAEKSDDRGHAIQILKIKNHTNIYDLNELKNILEADDIKDRKVVIVAIAGALRKGKSFLLNFFLRYLYAQYKYHDISDWMGENIPNELSGFSSRGGRKPDTMGILIWSDIFIYDHENGEKIAIILMDTQGTFDSRSSTKDCATVFALSTMLSSVQCYNLMHGIQEDDLQHLHMFTEYGRLALEQSNQKPFQNLFFIIRDWPHRLETDYGWHGEEVSDEALSENTDQTEDMRELRKSIKSNFENINAFLMPHPGKIVAEGRFQGNMDDIEAEFKEYLQILVPSLLASEKLVVKKINGEEVRAGDLVRYLEEYINIFTGATLPEPKSVFMVNLEYFLVH